MTGCDRPREAARGGIVSVTRRRHERTAPVVDLEPYEREGAVGFDRPSIREPAQRTARGAAVSGRAVAEHVAGAPNHDTHVVPVRPDPQVERAGRARGSAVDGLRDEFPGDRHERLANGARRRRHRPHAIGSRVGRTQIGIQRDRHVWKTTLTRHSAHRPQGVVVNDAAVRVWMSRRSRRACRFSRLPGRAGSVWRPVT